MQLVITYGAALELYHQRYWWWVVGQLLPNKLTQIALEQNQARRSRDPDAGHVISARSRRYLYSGTPEIKVHFLSELHAPLALILHILYGILPDHFHLSFPIRGHRRFHLTMLTTNVASHHLPEVVVDGISCVRTISQVQYNTGGCRI